MGLSGSFDLSRITNLENRLTTDEAVMLTNNNNGRQNIPYINGSGTFNPIVSIQDPANSCWWGIMQDSTLYNFALGRFTAGSKAIEVRAYYDNLTFRTGRSATATSADMNFVTNDQVVAGISQNMNLMPRGNLNLCPNNGALNTNGIAVLIDGFGFPKLKSINTGVSNMMIKFASNGIHSKDGADTVFEPFYASAFNVASDIGIKENIDDYKENALDQVKRTKVKYYNLKGKSKEPKRIGLIQQEAPDVIKADDNTVDLYGMINLLWKSVQELAAEVETLKGAAAG